MHAYKQSVKRNISNLRGGLLDMQLHSPATMGKLKTSFPASGSVAVMNLRSLQDVCLCLRVKKCLVIVTFSVCVTIHTPPNA